MKSSLIESWESFPLRVKVLFCFRRTSESPRENFYDGFVTYYRGRATAGDCPKLRGIRGREGKKSRNLFDSKKIKAAESGKLLN